MGRNYDYSMHRYLFGSKRKEAEIKEPKYFCGSCEKCINNRCMVFQRHVIPDYNRCFYHSNYSPHVVLFKPITNLEEIVLENYLKEVI